MNVAIYIAAIPCLILNAAYSLITPLENYCRLNWFLTAYLGVYFDFTVGVCMCYLLSMLKQQLTCVWTFQTETAKIHMSTLKNDNMAGQMFSDTTKSPTNLAKHI